MLPIIRNGAGRLNYIINARLVYHFGKHMGTAMGCERLPRTFCDDEGQRVAYHRAGTGPAVLLLHGLGGTADFWQPLVTQLVDRYTVLCPDLLGFGASDKPDLVYTPARHAQAVEAVLRAAEIHQLHAVVGHSCGGVIALVLLARGAVVTASLVLAAVPYPAPRYPIRLELLKSPLDRLMLTWRPFAHLIHMTLSMLWPVIQHIRVPPYLCGAWAGYMEHTIPSYVSTAEACLFRANLDPLLPAVQTCPTLLLHGPDDRTVPLVHGQRLAAVLPESTFAQLADGHYAVLQDGLTPLVSWLAATEQTIRAELGN